MTQDQQHALFIQAVAMLGGQRATARALGISERNVRYLIARTRTLHLGFIRDTANALDHHGRACRALAKALDPMFTANRTPEQQAKWEKAHG